MNAVVNTLKITYQGLEDQLWRVMEISSKATLLDLAFAALSSFEAECCHLFRFEIAGKAYDLPDVDPAGAPGVSSDLTAFRMEQLSLQPGDRFTLTYDFGAGHVFCFELLSQAPMKRGYGTHYPYVLDGAGLGIMEDCPPEETEAYLRTCQKYNVMCDNVLLKVRMADCYAGFYGEE